MTEGKTLWRGQFWEDLLKRWCLNLMELHHCQLWLFAKKQHSPHLKLLSYSTACIPHGVLCLWVCASEIKGMGSFVTVCVCLCYQMQVQWGQTVLRHWSLEQRKVYSRALWGDGWLMLLNLELPETFHPRFFKVKLREGHDSLLQTSWCRNPLFLLLSM